MSGQLQGSMLQAGDVHGDVHIHSVEYKTSQVVPRQLPHPPTFLTNRHHELALLAHSIRPSEQSSYTLVVLTGPGGVGKTALALAWLARVAEHYPAGQLYADCQVPGTAEPVLVEDVLGQFLRGLGVSPQAVPPDLAERTALFRTVTADKALAVLLDNVVSAAQVRTLLPSSSTSLVVVTSRHPLSGLQASGALLVTVDPLDEQSALELVARQIGAARVAAEREEATTLTRLCGGLPIALCVAGARIASRPHRPLARTLAELADERRRLEVLSVDDMSVRVTFDVSYAGLPDSAKRVYRALGRHPGSHVCAEMVAAAVDVQVPATRDDLETLVDANLLRDRGPDSYTMHDLVRLHARERAEREDTQHDQDVAVRRMLDWYVLAASSAGRVVMPARPTWTYEATFTVDFVAPQRFDGYQSTLDWLEDNRHNLVAGVHAAAEHGWPSTTCHLVRELQPLFVLHKHDHDAVTCYEAALRTAQRAGEWKFERHLRRQLARTYLALGQLEPAGELTEETVRECAQRNDRRGMAAALKTRGLLAARAGRHDDGVRAFTQSLELLRQLGHRRSAALCLIDLGTALTQLGRYAEATSTLEEAGAVLSNLEPADHYNTARAWAALGRTRANAGDYRAAESLLSRATIAFGELGSGYEHALAHASLAELAVLTDRPEAAEQHRTEAETLLGGVDLQRAWPIPRTGQ